MEPGDDDHSSSMEGNREEELQLDDHHIQEHDIPTPSSGPTISSDGAFRLRAPEKSQLLGRRQGLPPSAAGSKVQQHRRTVSETSIKQGCPRLFCNGRSAAAIHKSKRKTIWASDTSTNIQRYVIHESVGDTSTPMDEAGDHVAISDDEDGQEEEVEEFNDVGKRKLTLKVWLEIKKLKVNGQWKASCNYCHKELTSGPRAGTKNLVAHLKFLYSQEFKTQGRQDTPKDKIFEKVINPYLVEVLHHAQSIKMSEGMLHIRDVEGPKKTGNMETRIEEMEQHVFKCQGMVEHGLNANHVMITEFTNNHKMDSIDIGKHLSRLYDRFEDSGDSFILP
ncbi:40S ribosomal protein S5-1 [Hordeum vulgare]|nr:40S ribosomal protein S5-1 [Hordeum vulgare]